MTLRTLTPEQQTETAAATALHAALSAVDITKVPVLSRDRHIPRKEQAKLARALFRSLGLKGISVTAPNYSMASTVDVRLPKRRDHLMEDDFVVSRDPARKANSEAASRIGSILLAAFPQHDDRSDYQTDYFDNCWSIN